MNSNQEKIRQALECIETGLENINTDEEWLKFLSFQSLFYNYSFGNTMLIFAQKPEATYVKGYKAWNKLGRFVKRGSKGIQILAPCFRKIEDFKEPENKAEYQYAEGEKETKRVFSGFKVTYVFDVMDTDGSDEYLPVLIKGLSGNSVEEQQIYESLKAFISIEHEVKEVRGTASKGSFNLLTGVICIREDMEYLQKIKTIIHEYAHAIDFELHPQEDIERNRRELIAESVAFIVSQRLGLDTSSYSMSYIKSWLTDYKVIIINVQKVWNKNVQML